jgi:hypothetical protein
MVKDDHFLGGACRRLAVKHLVDAQAQHCTVLAQCRSPVGRSA